ncbi:ABC transporter substrate-binding protein [Streptomyces sp. NPDC091377]|uniref:ABC transporter substrate-binding protein n=1 Tax=Streptomyces sp. NPDC091377 TaxID=3365995 RepID=UPI00380925D0
METVNYLTSFNTFGRDAYVYVAAEKGYFRKAGLDVNITPGTGTVDVLKLIAAGRADFGAGDFSTLVITKAKEKLPVTAVAMVHQRSLAAIIALEGKGVKIPRDLVGKKIGDQPGSSNQVLFPVYAKAAGIKPSSVEFVPTAPPALPQLLVSGRVSGIGQFVVGVPLIERAAQGRKTVVLAYGEKLPFLYGNAIATSERIAEGRPDLVKKFTVALMQGLRHAVNHPEETGRILRKYQPTQDAEVASAEMSLMAPYVKPADFNGQLGAVDRRRVDQIIRMLASAEALPKGSVEADNVVDFSLVPGRGAEK